MVNLLKFQSLVACQKDLEAVWSVASLFAILTSNLWILALKTKILLEHRKKKVFVILEPLPKPRYILMLVILKVLHIWLVLCDIIKMAAPMSLFLPTFKYL